MEPTPVIVTIVGSTEGGFAARLQHPSAQGVMMEVLKTVFSTDHYRPHASVKFEGYYSKFDLPSGARLVLVICTVPKAPGKRHNVTLVYVPKNGLNVWKREFFPDEMKITSTDQDQFTIEAVDMRGRLTGSSKAIHYEVDCDGVQFNATSINRTPWSSSSVFDTPAGPLAWLPLPLHWHVHSLASQCSYTLSLPSTAQLADEDKQGEAIVHEEKNWSNSFPPAHNWIQARKGSSSICLAGGRTMGVDAFLVGYRNKELDLELDFRPPFAMKILGIAPFMVHRLDWDNRTFYLSVQDFTYKLVIEATGTRGTFFGLSSPMASGFQDNFMGQSLNAEVQVKLYKVTNRPFGKWHLLHTDVFERATLEFGAGYYPPRGTDESTH